MDVPDSAERPLLFHWNVGERRWWRLIMATLIGAVLLALASLAFRVVYPPALNLRLNAQRVTLLDPSSAAAREVLEAARDRDFLVLRESLPVRPEDVTTPVFTPGFKGYELRVREDLEATLEPDIIPKLFLPQRAPLPPIVATRARTPAPLPDQSIVPVVRSGLADRSILRSIKIVEPDAQGLQLRIGVNAVGRVITALPLNLSSEQTPALRSLPNQLANLRFAPKPGSDFEWGVLSLDWVRDQP
jgi:hypothetical protein